MKQKLLKLVKMLKRFSIDEIQSMLDIDEKEIKKIIKEFEKEQLIKKISVNEYAYYKIPSSANYNVIFDRQKQEQDVKFPKDPRKIFTKKEEQAIYDNAPGYAKPYLVKYYTVLSLARNFQGEALRVFLRNFGKEHPKYKMAPSTFLRLKRRYLEGGLAALIPRYGNASHIKSCVPPDMYKAFKNLYLAPSHYSVEECMKKLENLFDSSLIPSGASFKRLLYKEYSAAAVNKMRRIPLELPELVFNMDTPKINDKYNKYSAYIDGEKEFLKYLNSKNNQSSISMKTHIKKHVHPYFKDFKFKDVTQETLIDFQNLKLAQGYSVASVTRFIGAFSSIYNRHSDYIRKLQFSTKNSICPYSYNEVLSVSEIENIVEKNDYELWILSTGMSPAELVALDYSDINIKSKSVTINKILLDGVIQVPRKQYKLRTLPLPDVLISRMSQNKSGKIFDNVPSDRYEVLLNTHVKLLLNKKVPINIIYKNLGMQCINDFEQRFNTMLPQKLDENFDILN